MVVVPVLVKVSNDFEFCCKIRYVRGGVSALLLHLHPYQCSAGVLFYLPKRMKRNADINGI